MLGENICYSSNSMHVPFAQEPISEFRQRVAEMNACIPYTGVSVGARLEDPALTVLLSLLPLEAPAGVRPPPPTTRDAIRTINVLHCLQRLVTSVSVSNAILQTPGGALHQVSVKNVSSIPNC